MEEYLRLGWKFEIEYMAGWFYILASHSTYGKYFMQSQSPVLSMAEKRMKEKLDKFYFE